MRIAEEKQEVCCDCNTSCFDVPLCRQVGDYFKYIYLDQCLIFVYQNHIKEGS